MLAQATAGWIFAAFHLRIRLSLSLFASRRGSKGGATSEAKGHKESQGRHWLRFAFGALSSSLSISTRFSLAKKLFERHSNVLGLGASGAFTGGLAF